jgi:hypothetical protein
MYPTTLQSCLQQLRSPLFLTSPGNQSDQACCTNGSRFNHLVVRSHAVQNKDASM